ncbi:S-layer homology domain-containing protein [Paenibacillus soyae]|nr:S-layer homology domain-containing protein [Paenibacillus soyae]
MSKKLAILLVLCMTLTLLNPIGSALTVSAAGETGTIAPVKDKFDDEILSYDGDGGLNFIGYMSSFGQHTSHLQFDLAGQIDSGRALKQVELVLPILEGRIVRNQSSIDPYIKLYGAGDDGWSEASGEASDVPAFELDEFIMKKDISFSAYQAHFSPSEPSPPMLIRMDVTNFIKDQLVDSQDRQATFVLEGPNASDINAGASGEIRHYISISDADGPQNSAGVPYLLYEYEPNSPPTALSLSSNSIAENAASGTSIGTLTATDPDAGDTFTYALVPGGDAASFTIAGNSLRSNAVFNYEAKSSYGFEVEVTDSVGNKFKSPFTVQVTDVNEVPALTSVQINGGAATTNSNSVTVAVSSADPENNVTKLLLSNNNSDWTELTAGPSVTWPLASGDGLKTVYVKAKDAGGLESPVQSDTITLDQTAPSGGVTINGGQAHANAAAVTLTVDYGDAAQMRFSNEDLAWSGWTAAAVTHPWTLAPGDGEKTVYMELRDAAGNVSSPPSSDTILLDTAAPTEIQLSPGSIAENSESGTVVGTLSTTDPDSTGYVYELTGGDTASFTLTGTTISSNAVFDYEQKNSYTLNVKVTDLAGNAFTDTITVVVTNAPEPPVVTSVQINGGAAFTTSDSVTVTVAYDDPDGDVSRLLLSNDNSDWTELAPATSVPWTLAPGDGTKTVYVKARDAGGRESAVASDLIGLDMTIPSGSVTIEGGQTYVNDRDVNLSINYGDAAEMRFSNDGTGWSGWVSAAASYTWQLSAGDGEKTVYMELRDAANNVSIPPISDTIILDMTAPTSIQLSSNSIAENRAAGTTVGTLSTTDPDSAGYVYELTGVDSASFTLSGTTISSNEVFDYEQKNSYSLTLKVTDQAGNSFSDAMTILVTDVQEAPAISSVQINGGAAFTTSGSVTLNVSYTDPENNVSALLLSNDGNSWTELAASPSVSWTLAPGDGTKTVYVKAKDASGLESVEQSDAIVLDTTPPEVDGVTDGAKLNRAVEVSFNEGSATLNGSPFGTIDRTGTISTDGSYTLIVTDAAGLTTKVDFSIDATPPVVTGVADGAFYNSAVTPTYSDANPSSVLTATVNESPFTSGTIVSDNDEYLLLVKDDYDNETLIAFTIDKTAPAGTLTINNGAAETTSANVTLTLTATDATELDMRFSLDGTTWADGEWEAFVGEKSWTLAAGYGAKTVYVQLRDEAGNVNTTAISDSILYRSIPAAADSGVTGTEDTAIDFAQADFNYSNADGIPIDTVTILSLPEHGSLKLDGAAVEEDDEVPPADLDKLQFVPDSNWFGTTTFEWTVSANALEASGPADMEIEVTSVNDAPAAETLQFTTSIGRAVDGQLKATDIESDPLTYAIVDQPATGTIDLDESTGEFTFTPQPGNYSTVTFTYKVNDGLLDSAAATVTVRNNPPVIIVEPPKPPVIIDGLTGLPGVEVKVEIKDGQEVIVISLDGERLEDVIKKSEDGVITIDVGDKAKNVELGIDEKLLELLDEGNKTITIVMGGSSYGLSAAAIDELLRGWEGDSSKLVLEIKKADAMSSAKLERIADNKGFKLLVEPMSFQLYRQSGESRTKLTSVKGYLTISYGEEELKGQKPTTAVLLLPNGKAVHVPTRIEEQDGGFDMRVHSFAGGVFTLIAYETSFEDVSGWAKTYIDELASRLVVQGTGEGQFMPGRSVTRAEFASIITGALGLYNIENAGTFRDIEGDAWYAEAVAAAYAFGLISGYGDQTFRPDEQISREEAMVILSRAFGLMELKPDFTEDEQADALASFGDQDQLHAWSEEAVALTVLLGIVNGNGAGISPDEPMTRAQLAAVIVRLLQVGQFM